MRWLIAILILILTPLQTARGDEITLRIGSHSILATVANTPQSRERGLMKTVRLCENCGMLFVFPVAGKYTFWMKNTPLPLSIAFIAADGRIIDLVEMQANTLHFHCSSGHSLYALEMNQGWFSKHAIKPEDRVEELHLAPKGQ